MGFFKRLFGLEKEDQNEITQVPEMKEEPVRKSERTPIKKSATESGLVADPASAEKPNSEYKQKSANDAANNSAPEKIDESSPKKPEAKSFNIHNFFGIDLTTSPNENWIEDDADLDESGRPVRNFHIKNKKFDEVTAKVVGSEETTYTFVNRQGIDKALELYYVLLRDLKYNGHWQLWQCKNAHTKKFLDEMTHEDSWTCDDVRISFKWERYIYTTTIIVHTHAYNKDYLGAPKTIDITQLEPISEENFFGVNLNPISDNEWELENESGSHRSYKANLNSEKYIFDTCEINVSFYEYTFYAFSKKYSLEDALKVIFMIEQAFGNTGVDTMEKCMKKYGGKNFQGTINWTTPNEFSIDYSYDANKRTFSVVVWAFHNKLCLNPDGETPDSEKYSDSLSMPEKYYSIAKVRIQGFEKLDEDEKEFVMNDLEEDMHVYLRNEFDNPQDCHALQVWYHSNLIGYIDSKKAELVHSYLRNGKIGAIVVSRITSKDFKTIVDLNIYYEDAHGEELTPYYPLEGRQLSVIETDLWTGQEDWSKDWHLNLGTDELSYRFNEMFDDSVDDSEKTMVDIWFSSFMQNYLDGSCITEKGASHYLDYLNTDCAKKVLKKRIYSFMESKGFHFADKELFADEEETEQSTGEVVKQYEPTYELAYTDGQGHPQRKTIKNANMNSFVAGIKFRENYEEMLSKLEEGMELQIKPEPDNEYDPDALAVYHDDDHLGYIPKKDIPAVSLNMENGCGIAEIEYVDEEHIDLVVPVSFHKLSTMSDDELEDYRFYKTEKTKYEKGYIENSSPISKEEFLEGINQQKSNL